MPIRVPPGRAGRQWLRDRLAVAGNAGELLEQKRRVLVAESRRLRHLAETTRDQWEAAAREAERWALRAAVLGGERQLDLCRASMSRSAAAEVTWRSLMGLAYPWEADCRLGDPPDLSPCAGTSALAYAAAAHRSALEAGLQHAAVQRALDLVEREVEVTNRRSRAISRRWIPRLEHRLLLLERSLEEREREEIVRARWAGGQHTSGALR